MPAKGAAKALIIMAVCIMTAVGIGIYAWTQSKRPPILEIYIFDTPGAPALFMRTPDDSRILVDGGSNSDIVRRLTRVLPFYTRRIDAILATAADGLHAAGLVDVMDRYRVGKVFVPGLSLDGLGLSSSTDAAYQALLDAAEAGHAGIDLLMAGRRLSMGGVAIDMLFPRSHGDFKYSRASGPKLIFRVSYGATSVIFIGDATIKMQDFVAASSSRSDVLVVTDSASASNLSKRFVDAVDPDCLVYSKQVSSKDAKPSLTGKPKPDPLSAIMPDRRFNIRQKGAVRISSDGASMKIESLSI